MSEAELQRLQKASVRSAPKPKAPRVKDRRVEWNGMIFGSGAELARWQQLLLLEKAGAIRDLRRQVPFDLVVNGLLICRYVADAVYTDVLPEGARTVVEDTKGYRTEMYRMKKKLMRAVHGVDILET